MSVVTLHEVDLYRPCPHAVQLAQKASLAVALYVPSAHVLQLRSEEVVGATDCSWPGGQLLHAVQAADPSVALYVPLAQSVHTRSVVAVGATD